MSDKPQHNQGDVQEDRIVRFISQGLNQQDTSPQEKTSAGEASPAPEKKAGEKTPASEKRNKRSSAYIYLLILFGAAFFLLLLAYFVQQRNSETTISDLRDSMNLTREELMDEIKALETEKQTHLEEKEALQKERQTLESQLLDLQEQYNDAAGLGRQLEKDLQCWYDFWGLEMSFQAKDFEECAEFFRNVYGSNYYLTPETETAQRRIRLIYETLLDLGYLAEEDSHVFVPPEVTEAPGQ